jgi:hypothetical protein
MNERLASSRVEDLRELSADLFRKAGEAQTPKARQSFEDLASLYRQMAESLSELETLWKAAQERSKP